MWKSPIVHFKQNSCKQICRRWLPQQSSLLLGKSTNSFWFPNTVSGVNVTWRRIRARSDPESLIYWEVDLDEFVLVAVASRSDADDEGLESLVVVVVAVARYFRSRSIKSPLTKLLGSPIDTGKAFWVVSGSYRWHRNIVDIVGRRRLIFAICACWWEYWLITFHSWPRYLSFQRKQCLIWHHCMGVLLIWGAFAVGVKYWPAHFRFS